MVFDKGHSLLAWLPGLLAGARVLSDIRYFGKYKRSGVSTRTVPSSFMRRNVQASRFEYQTPIGRPLLSDIAKPCKDGLRTKALSLSLPLGHPAAFGAFPHRGCRLPLLAQPDDDTPDQDIGGVIRGDQQV